MAYTPDYLTKLNEQLKDRPVVFVEDKDGNSTEFKSNNRAARRNRIVYNGGWRMKQLPLSVLGKPGATPTGLGARRLALSSFDASKKD